MSNFRFLQKKRSKKYAMFSINCVPDPSMKFVILFGRLVNEKRGF